MKKESEMKEIKIIAVCPSPVILAGLASILSSTPDLRLLETLSDLSELSRKCISKSVADVVILDPPRAGCEQILLETVVSVAPEKIVYVSCDPATLARDIKFLTENGYAFVEATPVDMFP